MLEEQINQNPQAENSHSSMDLDIDEAVHAEGVSMEKIFAMKPKLIMIKATGVLPAFDQAQEDEESQKQCKIQKKVSKNKINTH